MYMHCACCIAVKCGKLYTYAMHGYVDEQIETALATQMCHYMQKSRYIATTFLQFVAMSSDISFHGVPHGHVVMELYT